MPDNTSTEAMDRLREVSQDALKALGDKVLTSAGDRISGVTDKLDSIAGGGPIGQAVEKGAKAKAKGESPVLGGVKGAASGVKDTIKDKITGGGSSGGKGGGDATKSTNIIESIDVGVPLRVAYNQWTEFGAFPSFMKKVENVEAAEDNKLNFKAQIFLSHRQWEATIMEQVPDEKIVWRSQGEKGHVDGSVTFHELSPTMTRILVVLEYYPQGFFEKTGNIWRAQGRRARAELRHFRRHVMTRTILDPDEVEGWRGRIEDGEVVETHEEALEREEQENADEGQYDDEYESDDGEEGAEDDEGPEDEYEEADEDGEEPTDSDEYDEDDEDQDSEPEDEYVDDEEDSDEYVDEGEDEEDEDEDELRPRRRRRAS